MLETLIHPVMKKLFQQLISVCFLFSIISASGQSAPAHTVSEKSLVKQFFCDEIFYPEEALKNGIEGKVKLMFYLDEEGEVTDIDVTNSVSPEIDDECIRVFRMLVWKPAMRLGTPVKSRYTYEVDFNIRKYKKKCLARGYDQLVYPYFPVDTSYLIYTFDQVDQGPYPIFGKAGMNINAFIKENIEYPDEAFKQDLSGTVILNFIVEAHGRISNITIKKDVSGGCSQEATRLVKLLSWMPGINDNMAVRTRVTMDITFNLDAESGHSFFNSDQMNN